MVSAPAWAAAGREPGVQVADRDRELIRRHPAGQPGVGVVGHHVQRLVRRSANPDRRMRLLPGLGIDGGVVEVHETPVVGRRVLSPDCLHRFQVLPGLGDLGGPADPQYLEIYVKRALRRALADAQVDPAAGQVVDAGDLLGGHQRLAIREDQHRHAEPDRLGHRRAVGQGRKRLVEHRRVVRPGRLERLAGPARDVHRVQCLVPDQVVVDPQRVEADPVRLHRRGADGLR